MRILGILFLISSLTLGVIGTAHAGHDNGKGNGGNNNGKGNGKGGSISAPELDPGALGSGLTLAAGLVLLLNERRRSDS
jgi:hypothetical protein